MPVEQVVPGVCRVGGDGWGDALPPLSSDGDANVYVLALDGADVLVDCGATGGHDAIERNLREAGHDPAGIRDLVLTHSHFDHTGSAAEWQERHGVRVHLNATGAEFLARGDHRLVGYQVLGPGHAFRPFTVDHAVGDGETFRLGRSTVEAHHMPGHTPDSTLYVLRHGGLRIGVCGDVAFAARNDREERLGLLSALWLSDLDRYVETLERLARLDLDLLLPGHGHAVSGRARVGERIATALGVAQFLAEEPRVRWNLGV